jgi:Ribbon-helix-helix protein, copG family
MSTQTPAPPERRRTQTKGGLLREQLYLYADEAEALEEAARRERCSKSELIRRALRQYLKMTMG